MTKWEQASIPKKLPDKDRGTNIDNTLPKFVSIYKYLNSNKLAFSIINNLFLYPYYLYVRIGENEKSGNSSQYLQDMVNSKMTESNGTLNECLI